MAKVTNSKRSGSYYKMVNTSSGKKAGGRK